MDKIELSFVVAGAPKAASTSLVEALRPHPEIFLPSRKELSFFDREGCLERLSELEPHFEVAAPGQLCGEGTPWYMSSPRAARYLAQLYPVLRVIFLLREPVAPAQSHYLHRVVRNAEYRSFAQALDDELSKLDTEDDGSRRNYLIPPGLYASHIKTWQSHFRPDQIKIVLFEDLIGDPGRTLRSVQEHIGVTPHDLELPAANRTQSVRAPGVGRLAAKLILTQHWGKRLAKRMTPKAFRSWTVKTVAKLNSSDQKRPSLHLGDSQVAVLREHFDPEIDELARLLERPLDSWRPG